MDKVFVARLGHSATGTLMIAGILCHRDYSSAPAADAERRRDEGSPAAGGPIARASAEAACRMTTDLAECPEKARLL